jgi:ribosome maturation factor RimP
VALGCTSVCESGLCPLFLLPFFGKGLRRAGLTRLFFYPHFQRQRLQKQNTVEDGADRLIATIQGFAEPLLRDLEIELVDIQFRREGHGWVLRFFIDKEGGIGIDDCATVSRRISAHLEVEDLVTHPYHLEVSSPGLERPLKKQGDFLRFVGRSARIKVREPLGEQRVLLGILRGLEEENVILEMEQETVRIELENISKARLML